jgi:uncharacterized protein
VQTTSIPLAGLDEQGFALTPPLLTPDECDALAAGFDDDARYRSTVDMGRHRFGAGRYRYFDHPLPEPVERVRRELYPPLAEVANRWADQLGEPADYPDELDEFLARCHAAGQTRPTPLILRYGAGGHNTLHQDLYGDVAFPLQAVTVLDEDFTGGEFVLLEQRPRAQSRAHVVPLERGAGTIAWPCATASPPSTAGSARRWASSSTTPHRAFPRLKAP